MKRTQKLTLCALMIATAVILSLISKIIPAPWLQGGSVTLASAVPIIYIGIRFGIKWGMATSLVYAILQMMMGFYPPPTRTLLSFVLVVFLDYIIAYGVYGLGGLFCSKNKFYTIPLAGFTATFLRYICHILSGILIWGVYAPEGQSVHAYSFIYNGTYMIPEIIITTVVFALLMKNKHLFKTSHSK